MNIMDVKLDLWGLEIGIIPIVVGVFVILFSLSFIFYYCVPARRVKRALRQTKNALSSLHKQLGTQPAINDKISPIFESHKDLKHHWSEYQETLHEQYDENEGSKIISKIRATVPSEIFFSSNAIIDSSINAEFYKHLPGILTGIGIIGTFLGLIGGLHSFEPSIDPDVLNDGLNGLMNSVKEAFIASCFAITVAMVITVAEKIQLNSLFKDLDALTQEIDKLYDAGAGEEYLAELVASTTANTTNTRQLKDSLVEDLKTLLTELTDRQIAASDTSSKAMAEQIGDSISQNLKGPLDKISDVVERASGQQGKMVETALQGVLSAFIANLQDVFGDQMKGVSTMMTDSAAALQEVQSNLSRLVDDFSNAGTTATQDMSERFTAMMLEADERQKSTMDAIALAMGNVQEQLSNSQSDIASQMAQSVNDFKDTMHLTLSEMAEKRESMEERSKDGIDAINERVLTLVEEFGKRATSSIDDQKEAMDSAFTGVTGQMEQYLTSASEHHKSVEESTSSMVQELRDSVEELIYESKESSVSYRESIKRLDEITTEAISGMSSGAVKIQTASEKFTLAGQSVSETLENSREVSDELRAAGTLLNETQKTLSSVISSYTQSREGIEKLVVTLREVSQDVENRATLGKQVVLDMEQLVSRFEQVQKQTEDYLANVSGVLATGFEDFSSGVTEGMRKSRGEFDSALTTSVGVLNTHLAEVGTFLENLEDAINSSTDRLNA